MRIALVAVLLGLSLGCASVRSVEDGSLYRSGQLSAKQLEDVIKSRGVKTVVNLRGMQPDRNWYRDEQQVCRQNGVEMIDVSLDSSAPERGEVAALLDAYHNAPRPILVHSWSSSGGAGLASGLYRTAVLQQSNDEARRELAWWQSSRWPVRTLAAHDQFLKDWQGEREFFANYQLAGRDQLPELAEKSVATLKPSLPPEYGGPASPGSLPPPAIDLFDHGAGGNRPANHADSYSLPSLGAATHRQVAWFGRPVEADE